MKSQFSTICGRIATQHPHFIDPQSPDSSIYCTETPFYSISLCFIEFFTTIIGDICLLRSKTFELNNLEISPTTKGILKECRRRRLLHASTKGISTTCCRLWSHLSKPPPPLSLCLPVRAPPPPINPGECIISAPNNPHHPHPSSDDKIRHATRERGAAEIRVKGRHENTKNWEKSSSFCYLNSPGLLRCVWKKNSIDYVHTQINFMFYNPLPV